MGQAAKPTPFHVELFPLHSPLLGESLLVSFPPLNNMLKFRGFSRFIWDLIQSTTSDKSEVQFPTPFLPGRRGDTMKWRTLAHNKFTRSETNYMPTHSQRHNEVKLETGEGRSDLKRASSLAAAVALKSHTQWRLIRTDTQRGVLSGLSRERNLRSKIWWFTEFCNSHYVSHFAAFFIVTRTKISVAKSCSRFVFRLKVTPRLTAVSPLVYFSTLFYKRG
jgi:hypothetical protein